MINWREFTVYFCNYNEWKTKIIAKIGHLMQIHVYTFSTCFDHFTFLKLDVVKVIQEY